jgi:hypothetical protein
MQVNLTGLPALIVDVGFIVVFAAPVWLAARLVRARHPTLLRSALSLLVGTVFSFVSLAIGGPWIFVLGPLSFVLAFKWVLGTSFPGALGLALLALLAYAVVIHLFGAGIVFQDAVAPPGGLRT